MKIKSKGKEYNILLDEDCIDIIADKTWWIKDNGYVYTQIKDGKKRKSVYIHRLIMDPKPGLEVDHINGDKLDNRRCNLRVCTRSQNNMNKKAGVTKFRNKWRARIKKDGIEYHLGLFDKFEDALEARKKKASELFDNFAYNYETIK